MCIPPLGLGCKADVSDCTWGEDDKIVLKYSSHDRQIHLFYSKKNMKFRKIQTYIVNVCFKAVKNLPF